MVDQVALAKLTTEAGVRMDSARTMDHCLGEAFRQVKVRKGPFILNLPQNVQQTEMPDPEWAYEPMYRSNDLQPPRSQDVEEAVRLLASAERPTILCGLGAVSATAESEVRRPAEHLGAPVGVSLLASGFCGDYPLYLGISGGLGSPLTVDTLADSNVTLVVGASPNEWTTDFGKLVKNGKKIIHIDNRPDAFGWFARVAIGMTADARTAVGALAERLSATTKARPLNAQILLKIQERNASTRKVSYDDGDSVEPRRAAQYLEDTLPKDDRVVVLDGGHAAMICTKTLSVPRARNWGLGWDFGAIGQGLAITIGACFARPGQRVTHATGDASFMMNVADFQTAVRHKLPLTVIVFNDNAVGQEKHDLVHKKLNPSYADTPEADFAKLAVGLGAKSFSVRTPDDLGEINKALALGVEEGPVVIDVRINGDIKLAASWEIAKHLS
jgi:acetolactate synthase-1/2/3 large subunit